VDHTSEKSSYVSEAHFATEDHELEIGGAQLRVRQLLSSAHKRRSIVFLHDSLGCIAVWRDFPELLAQAADCNAVIYDRQGYGRSSPVTEPRTKGYLEKEAHTLLELCDKLKLERPVLFGHSDGGTIALLAAGMAPTSFAGVISEGAHVFVEELSIAGIKKAKEIYQTTNLKTRLEKYHGDKTDTVFSIWADTWCSPEFRDWNMEDKLSLIQCPVLVLQGSEDEYGTRDQVDTIANKVSGPVQPHLIPGVAHTPHKHAVDEVLRLSVQFISRLTLPK
jgi:pimeloyl-ACP methyl ester carboxylesterase